MAREAVSIEVLAGEFEDQLEVFSHWLTVAEDHGLTTDPDLIEVISREDPAQRLSHFFHRDTVAEIEDAMGLATTLMLLLPGATHPAPVGNLPRLRALGLYAGTRVVPG